MSNLKIATAGSKKKNRLITPEQMVKELLAQAHVTGARLGLSSAECDRIACAVAASIGQARFPL